MSNRHVLIPCKRFALGKSRLAPLLSIVERFRLCRHLLATTIEVARGLAASDRIWVVTSDEEAGAIARRCGVCQLDDNASDLNGALEGARASLFDRRALQTESPDILVMPIDLPFATAPVIQECVERDVEVVLATDLAGVGTNILRLRGLSARALPFAFGSCSLAAHREAAIARQYTWWISRDARLAFDLDEPRDLKRTLEARLSRAS